MAPSGHIGQVSHLAICSSKAATITAKGAVAGRSAGDIAQTVIQVDTRGVCPIDVTRFPCSPVQDATRDAEPLDRAQT